MNREKKKLTWAVGLVAGLGVLSIAYAALSSTLNIQGENASVNVGYVRFVGRDESQLDCCKPVGIGSTNKEYILNNNASGTETKSGGIFERTDGETGMISSDNFDQNWAKALALPGSMDLDSEVIKKNDRAVVWDANFNDYGSFVVYQLIIKNDAYNDMKLKSIPDIVVYESDGTTKYTGNNIKAELYTDYDSTNFVDPCKNKITAYGGNSAAAKTTYNYIKPGEKTIWYLKVGYENYNETTNNMVGSKGFSFKTAPNWEAVMS